MIYLLSHYTLVGFTIAVVALMYVMLLVIKLIFIGSEEDYEDDEGLGIYGRFRSCTPFFVIRIYSKTRRFLWILQSLYGFSIKSRIWDRADFFIDFIFVILSVVTNDSRFLFMPVSNIVLFSITSPAKYIEGAKVLRYVLIFLLTIALWATIIILNDHSTIIGTILSHFNTIK